MKKESLLWYKEGFKVAAPVAIHRVGVDFH